MLSFVGMIYILSMMIPMAGKGTVFDQYTMVSTILCIFSLYLNRYYENEAFEIHAGISIVGHLFFLEMGIVYSRGANQLLTQDFDELVESYKQFDPLVYPKIHDIL